MKFLIAALSLLTAPVWAASALSVVTISQTLTMTSPSALISGTGPTATISMTNGYFKNISTTNFVASAGGVSLVSDSLIRAKVVFDASASPTTIARAYNVSGIVVQSSGVFAIKGTFPANPVISCMSNATSTAQGWKYLGTPTTTSATIYFFNTTTGGAQVTGSTYSTCSFM